MKKMIKRLKKKLQDKPMITWNRIALKILIFIHIIDNGLIIILNYEFDDYIGISILYLLISNIAVYKALERLWA